MNYFNPVTPERGEPNANAIDISSYGIAPYNIFSPFTYSKRIHIPVPGHPDIFSNSVEAIWQGLKIIEGQTDFSLLQRRPKKRKGHVSGHQLGNDILGIIDARLEIYAPAYEHYFDNYIDCEVKDDLAKKALTEAVLFYDTEDNLDIEDPQPLAHSVFTCDLMNKYVRSLFKKVISVFEEEYACSGNETLAGPVTRSIKQFKAMRDVEQTIARIVLRSAFGKDAFHKRYYETLGERLL